MKWNFWVARRKSPGKNKQGMREGMEAIICVVHNDGESSMCE